MHLWDEHHNSEVSEAPRKMTQISREKQFNDLLVLALVSRVVGELAD